jgi:sporulation integral membrane protein YtvI
MLTFYKKYARTAFDIGLIILTIYLIMFIFSLIYSIAKPIFVGFLIFLMIEPLARYLHRKGMKKSIATTISTLVFILVIVGALIIAGIIFVSEIRQLVQFIPMYADFLQEQIMVQTKYIQQKLGTLPPEYFQKISDYSVTIAEKGGEFLKNILLLLIGNLTAVPAMLFNFVIGLVLAYFLSIEIDYWKKLAKEKTPRTFKNAFLFLRENVLKGITTYIKAQLKLISFTFLIIFIALLLLGVNNAFSIALLSAIFDMLPILGVSTVFIPWIIYLLIVGQMPLAIWLAALLAGVVIFRQIAEPKITGDSLGVSAFTMLSFMIISLSLFGVAGLILSPVLLILIKSLYEQGYLHKWIRMPEGEYEEK